MGGCNGLRVGDNLYGAESLLLPVSLGRSVAVAQSV